MRRNLPPMSSLEYALLRIEHARIEVNEARTAVRDEHPELFALLDMTAAYLKTARLKTKREIKKS